MRSHGRNRNSGQRSRPARMRAVAGVVTLLSLFTVATAGCGGEPAAPSATPPPQTGDSSPTAPGVPAADARTMPKSKPARVRIPAIGVDSSVIDLGLDPAGRMTVPPDGTAAGWYTGAPTPGELGPAIIAGHVDWGGRPGVFHRLRTLKPGDRVTVLRVDGSTATFRVTRVKQYSKEKFPTDAVYGDIDHAGLRLITCGGSFDPQARSYRDNIVVFAQLSDKA